MRSMRLWPFKIFILGAVLVLLDPLCSYGDESTLLRLNQIGPKVYRGGQPTEVGLAELKALGVKTIVNFRHEEDWIEREKGLVESLGMTYVSLPWKIYQQPDKELVEQFVRITGDSARQPVFFHCRRGVERTGVMSAVYYRSQLGLSQREAKDKAFTDFPVNWFWKYSIRKRLKGFEKQLSLQ